MHTWVRLGTGRSCSSLHTRPAIRACSAVSNFWPYWTGNTSCKKREICVIKKMSYTVSQIRFTGSTSDTTGYVHNNTFYFKAGSDVGVFSRASIDKNNFWNVYLNDHKIYPALDLKMKVLCDVCQCEKNRCGYLKKMLPLSWVFKKILDKHHEICLRFLHFCVLLQHRTKSYVKKSQ